MEVSHFSMLHRTTPQPAAGQPSASAPPVCDQVHASEHARGSPRTIPLTAIILTHQEEANLSACLESLCGCVGDVVIVDSGSSDRTLDIARDYGARILSHPFETHARQWQWALNQVQSALSPGADHWILGLDADQRLTPELRDELLELWSDSGRVQLAGVNGFYLCRRQIFRGRWIRHGGYYPIYLLKLFRLSRVRFDEHDLVDHHFYVDGPVGTLRHDLIEDNRKEHDISFWIEKHTRYAARLAQEEHARRTALDKAPLPPRLFGTRDQRRLWLKSRWFRLPLFVRPFLYFLYRYILRLGFLDGKPGLIFHFLHACWFRFLVDVHLDELRARKQRTPSADATGVSSTLNPVEGGGPRTHQLSQTNRTGDDAE